MVALGVTHRVQSIKNIKAVIKEGIATMDKYAFPEGLEPDVVRKAMYEKDQELQKNGPRIICRMATSPMGLIFIGDTKRAEKEMDALVMKLTEKLPTSFRPKDNRIIT